MEKSSEDLKQDALPGSGQNVKTLPGHWVLARLGKKVLRPGGRKMTEAMLKTLNIAAQDSVVEFAPGMGFTVQLCLMKQPKTYVAVERDDGAAKVVRRYLNGDTQRCVVSSAEETGLDTGTATVVYGEAMLTMQSDRKKQKIIAEAARLLKVGGRYGIHEHCIVPNDIDPAKRLEIQQAIAKSIQSAVKPLTQDEWVSMLQESGFTTKAHQITNMHLLEPRRVIEDEGPFGTLKILGNAIIDHDARRRVIGMRRVFKKYESNLAAIMVVGVKDHGNNDQDEGNI